jgi:hypothetical protein
MKLSQNSESRRNRAQAPPGNQQNDDFRSTILSGPIIVKQFQTDPPSQLMKHGK